VRRFEEKSRDRKNKLKMKGLEVDLGVAMAISMAAEMLEERFTS